jgi:integrase
VRIPIIHKLTLDNVQERFFEQDMFILARSCLQVDYQLAITIDKVYGWRTQSEVLTRQWRHVDLTVGTLRLDPGEAKNKNGRVVYLTQELQTMFAAQLARVRALEQKLGKVIPYVFPHLEGHLQGTRIKDFKIAWKTACIKAGCPGMHRHDFRRTAVRNFESAGVPRSIAMKNTGHRTESVYIPYDILDDADQRMARDMIETHSSLIVGALPLAEEHVHG